MLSFIGWTVGAFCLMEIAAYVLHRFLFHGLLWKVHQTHHRPDHHHGPLEWNDLFSLGFAAASMGLMWAGHEAPVESVAFPVGLGIALYGLAYFVLHDLYAHKRFWPIQLKNEAARTVKTAHQRHHQSVEKHGQEPYGLFLFPYSKHKPFRRSKRPHARID
jgi:beta-carotene 3-hydroxylase